MDSGATNPAPGPEALIIQAATPTPAPNFEIGQGPHYQAEQEFLAQCGALSDEEKQKVHSFFESKGFQQMFKASAFELEAAKDLKAWDTLPHHAKRILKAVDVEKKVQQRIFKHPRDGLPRPCILAHRGSPQYHAPHSLAGYHEAVEAGADFIEFDVNSTKDHKLIICHDVTLNSETDVAEKFPEKFSKEEILSAIDGDPLHMEGHFAKDFTLGEISTLKKPRGEFEVVKEGEEKEVARVNTVVSAAAFLENLRKDASRNFGLVIELKRPQWHKDIGLPLEDQLIADIEASGFQGPILIQCFEAAPLRYIKEKRPQWSYMQLLIDVGTAIDIGMDPKVAVPDDPAKFEEFFKKIAEYADVVSPWKISIVPDPLFPPENSPLVAVCSELGMEVMPYVFRSDAKNLSQVYGGNATEEYRRFYKLGCAGFFSDYPDHARHARDIMLMLPKDAHWIPSAFLMTEAGATRSQINSHFGTKF